ncbi:dynein intermediate chain 4, axonemal-like isoform X2 [Gigantopelta aegis]|uniref:dynein intermediate chain 4, axonemal-like isoform X2 n=1 Tax=Gigantopelta aegis TaxID=1735272 RepID=UPI001B887C9D|nr:dynein intermediate chain 4, axonemal-like isoform X2 [Gigantopelta aegis]
MSTGKGKTLLAPGPVQGQGQMSFAKKSTSSGSRPKYAGIPKSHIGSRVSSSANKKSPSVGMEKSLKVHQVHVFDESGLDVTPLPLLYVDPNALRKNQGNILGDSSGGTPTDFMSTASMSIYNTGASTAASVLGGGPFSRSVFSQSYDTGTGSGTEDLHHADHAPTESAWAEIRHKREEVQEFLTPEDLELFVDLTLSETETIWLLDMPDVLVSSEATDAEAIKERNTTYANLVKSRLGNDLYAERGMNTFNEPRKLKNVQTSKITRVDIGIMCTTWDMFDTYEKVDKETKAKKDKEDDVEETISHPATPKSPEGETADDVASLLLSSKENTMDSFSKRKDSQATVGSSTTGLESLFPGRDLVGSVMSTEINVHDEEKIMHSEALQRDLFFMERVINLNTYQSKQAHYRGFPVISDIDGAADNKGQVAVQDMGPNLERLWTYNCQLTKGRNVSCMVWNTLNPDLIAIGYGQFEFTNQKGGLVCCWSLKNIEYPERVYNCKEGVTALDFSRTNPNLLTIGLYDGGVAIYNVRNTKDEPIVDNFGNPGKHTAPVWQVQWIEKERGSGEEKTEVVVSVSTDGKITQWSIRKGFESYELMRLKRVPMKMGGKAKEKKTEAFISRNAGGLCFDFYSRDSNVYLAGTEDGQIHKCSCSYNEQYLETYSGHTGPVYKIHWSPYIKDIFLSCSADWSVRLWHQDQQKPILSFFSSTKPVNDVDWSPQSSTVFACVNNGAVEVWDLSTSTLDPVIINNPTSEATQTTVVFAKNSNCILVGDSEGQVTVYQLSSMPNPPEDQVAALNRVIKSTLASQLETTTEATEQ